MSATLTLGSGLPVALGQIDRELKKLWEQSGGVATRASLINLAVYCEGRDAMEENTGLIARITEEHACRALLICLDRQATEERVRAWISAHCHMSRAGAKQVCSEQITFLLEGAPASLIPNIVFSHLDSDLPLYLWWQGEFSDPLESQLWTWVDRLIFDSNTWCERAAQLRLLRDSLARVKCRLTLCDLNWTRSLYFRQALAVTFDHPENLALLGNIGGVVITHGPGHACTALLVAGWLAAQLGWTEGSRSGSRLEFQSASGSPVSVELRSSPGAPVGEIALKADGGLVRIWREGVSQFLHAAIGMPDGRRFSNLYPAGGDDSAALVIEELIRGGHHRVYLAAMEVAGGLF